MKNLLTVILTTSFLLWSMIVIGQKDNVKNKVNDCYRYAQKAGSAVDDVSIDIGNSRSSSTFSDMQYYADRAKSDIGYAIDYSKKAKNEAGDAANEALNIKCGLAESKGSDAEEFFKKAQSEFDAAYISISSATYENEADGLRSYLRTALNYIDNGMNYLKKGVDELNGIMSELDKCK